MNLSASTEPTATLPLVWGAANIAKAIGRTQRATEFLLWEGKIPGAKRVGKRYVLDVEAFRKSLAA